MKIAVASGKGGTGKTTITASLVRVLSNTGRSVQYLDCDVEEPNGHLFLKPKWDKSDSVTVPVPEVITGKCIGCGKCGEICQYSAITCIKGRVPRHADSRSNAGSLASPGDRVAAREYSPGPPGKVLTFPELCHGCGGCLRVCPTSAIREVEREVGVIESGKSGDIDFVHGRLHVGEAMSPPLIRKVRETAETGKNTLIDAPPGTSCPVITAINHVDFVMLATEPTPFGLSDLALALDMVRELKLPHAVVVNRHEDGNDSARRFCKEKGVGIAGEIPDDRRIAEAYSRGDLPVDALPEYQNTFRAIWARANNMMVPA